MRVNELAELVVLISTGAYLFYRWDDHAAHGSGFWFFACVNSIIAIIVAGGVYLCVRSRIRATPFRGLAASFALAIAVGFLTSMGEDLWRFQILGGPGSKEMMQLVSTQENIVPGSESQWRQTASLRIRREFMATVFMTGLIGCYISRLPCSRESEVEDASNDFG